MLTISYVFNTTSNIHFSLYYFITILKTYKYSSAPSPYWAQRIWHCLARWPVQLLSTDITQTGTISYSLRLTTLHAGQLDVFILIM